MKDKLGSKVMFFIGLGLVIIAAVLMLGKFTEENDFPFSIILAVMGVIFIAASRFRLLKSKK